MQVGMIDDFEKHKYLEKNLSTAIFFYHMNRPKIESGPLLGYDNVGHNQHSKHAQ
jgi:hypothetical protein